MNDEEILRFALKRYFQIIQNSRKKKNCILRRASQNTGA
jgi:hypothetical protein